MHHNHKHKKGKHDGSNSDHGSLDGSTTESENDSDQELDRDRHEGDVRNEALNTIIWKHEEDVDIGDTDDDVGGGQESNHELW